MGELDLIGEVLDGRYRVELRLGAGGMATVYLARQETLDRLVVVKVPDSSLLQDKPFRARFRLEIKSMVKLRHPHIVTVLEAGEIDGTPYSVMEYLDGGSLKDRLQEKAGKGRRETPAEVLEWLRSVADALDFIHDEKVVHRDVKPANILFDARGNPCLSDFGIAKALGAVDTNITRTGATPGTPTYMAPEAGTSATLEGPADQYALGVTVYEALSGKVPYEGDTPMAVMLKKLTEPPLPLFEAAPDLQPGIACVVMRAVAQEPQKRYDTCIAFAEAFAEAASKAGGMAPRAEATGTLFRPERRQAPTGSPPEERRPLPWKAVGITAVILLLLLVGGYLLAGGIWRPASEGDRKSTPPGPPPVRFVLTNSPQAGSLVRDARAVFAGRIEGPGYLALNGIRYEVDKDGTFSITADLKDGSNELVLRCIGPDGREIERVEAKITLDSERPTVRIDELENGFLTGEGQVEVRGAVLDQHPSHAVVGGARVELAPDGTFRGLAKLDQEGENALEILGFDRAGWSRTAQLIVVRDTSDPELEVEVPPRASPTKEATVALTCRIRDRNPSHLLVNGRRVELPAEGAKLALPLAEGDNRLEIVAVDRAGHESARQLLVVTRDSKPPVVTLDNLPGEMEDPAVEVSGGVNEAGCSVSVNGRDATMSGRRFSVTVPLSVGSNPIVANARDGVGLTGKAETSITRKQRDTSPPVVMLDTLPRETEEPAVRVSGAVSEGGYSVSVNGHKAILTGKRFSVTLPLIIGSNPIVVQATDRVGLVGKAETSITRKTLDLLDATYRRLVAQSRWTSVSPERNRAGLWRLSHTKTKLVFVLIRAGRFTMGSPTKEAKRNDDETLHLVTIRKPFLLCETECTQKAWERGGGENDSHFKGAERPVERVSWVDCRAWCTSNGLRLPSEAEWEYACRAGTTTPFSFGPTITPSQVNYDGDHPYRGESMGQDRQQTVSVRGLPSNPWGLFEMHGNVWEWCEDWYGKYEEAPSDGSARTKRNGATRQVSRGGSWRNIARDCRSADRYMYSPRYRISNLGFRPACWP